MKSVDPPLPQPPTPADPAGSPGQTSEQLRLALQVAQIATWRQDLAAGTVNFDERGAKLLGIEGARRDVSAAQAREWVHPDDLERVHATVASALQTTGHVDFEARYRRGGGWATILTRVVVERSPSGEPIALLGVALDVTERHAARRQASELAERLEATADAAGIGLWSWNLGSNERTWNAQMWALCGLVPQAQSPEFDDWVSTAVHPGDRDRLLGGPERWRATTRTRLDGEFRIVRPDGVVRWLAGRTHVDDTADGRMLYGVLWDVTERHAAQDALREAYERAALAARGAGIGTWERDPARGTTHWDAQMYRLRGLDPARTDATHGMSLASIHPDDRALVEAHHQRAAARGEPVTYEFRVLWPDGSMHWLASRALGVFDDAGALQRLIGVNWDVTAQKTARDERAEKEAALRESRAKSEFLARMSHELRTPLNAVLGFTQLLQAEEDGSAPARSEKLQHIRTGGEHLLALINEVLDLSSLESGQMRLNLDATPVAEVAREALAMVERLAAARGITLEIGALDGIVMADRTRLRQILINLLSNAIKFNRPDGRVAIRCRVSGTRVVLRVADTGRGMTTEQLSHLFEPFNRLGAEREGIEGTGIGLVIVKVIVERMGGTLRVASRPGRGTAFEVRLRTPDSTTDPMALSAAMPLAPPDARPALRGAKLLYIEDNPVNTLLVRELVAQRPGLELVCEPDGSSGIARARELRPDLVLVDMQLPDMDGHEVLRRLRADPATAAAPCIALTANVLTEDIERALAAGFADYWTKPIDLNAFLASLDALFGSQAS
jgi:PAS domain S-box-containing protein